MTRYDEEFGTGQPADGLEDELRRMLAVREADITEPARHRPDGERLPLPPHRPAELPGRRAGTLLAAAVVALLMLGSAFAVRGLNHRHSPAGSSNSPTVSAPPASSPLVSPSPSASPSSTAEARSCPLPAGWTAALAGGRIAVDQPQNSPVSAGPGGSFLMMQTASGPGPGGETDFTHAELAIFDRAGHGSTVWQAADPVHDEVDYSPDSAISADWVVFGLSRSQNLAAHGVVAWNRATGRSSTLRLLTAAEEAANTVIAFDPIVAGDTAYWVEQKYGNGADQTLVSQPLPAGRRTSQPISRFGRLVALGSGVLVLRYQDSGLPGPDSGMMSMTAGPGLRLPPKLAGSLGFGFSWDGGTLRWLNDENAPSAVSSWVPGQSAASTARFPVASPESRLVGPFLDQLGQGDLLDTRTGRTLRLPAGLSFALVTGGDLITGTGTTKLGATTVHRVPLSALPPVAC